MLQLAFAHFQRFALARGDSTRHDVRHGEARMHLIIMWLGGITAGLGAFFFLMMVIVDGRGNPLGMVYALGIGGGLVVSGAMLYCFGAIVAHLAAIRKATEAQAKFFAERFTKPAP